MTDRDLKKAESMPLYYNGCLAYSYFLLHKSFMVSTGQERYILDRRFIDAARVGVMSTILMAIKEDLVENAPNLNYESKILDGELQKVVSMIAEKTSDGYVVDNYTFKDAPTLVALIRNKLAHGNFSLDLNHSKIIFYIDDAEIKINIRKLASFIASALSRYLEINDSVYNKSIVVNNDVISNRTKIMTNPKEILRNLKNFRLLNIKSSRVDGEPYTNEEKRKIENLFETFQKSNNDVTILRKFSEENKEVYNFDYTFSKIKEDYFEKLAISEAKSVDPSTNYAGQMIHLSNVLLYESVRDEKMKLMCYGLNNLVILDAIYAEGSIRDERIDKFVANSGFSLITLSYNELATSLISQFNSLFSYLNDSVFKDNNQYTSLSLDGLDYSKLDLSDLTVSTYTIDDKYIKDVKEKRNGKIKEINLINKSIEKTKESLKNLSGSQNIKALSVLNSKLSNYSALLPQLYSELKEMDDAINYFNNNQEYFIKRAIINGIRNSISHGNYMISPFDTFETATITFNDIYEGELTFNAEIKLDSFLNFLDKNQEYVLNYVKGLTTPSEEKTHIK